jgi:hypothetical protein
MFRELSLAVFGLFLLGNVQASMQIFIEDSLGDVIACEVDGFTQNSWGDVIVSNPGCLGSVVSNPVNDDKLVLGEKRCGFSSMRMDETGRVVITASNSCVISQPVSFTLRDDDYEMSCETDVVSQGGAGVLHLDGSTCAAALKEGPASHSFGSMVLKDGPIVRECAFESMSMDAAGNIEVVARGSCFGDSDGDLIPDPMDPDNAVAAGDDCLIAGDASWETISISGARYSDDVTCELPKPDYIVVADVVFGGFNHEPLSYPPDVPIVADYYATQSIALLGPVSVKGGSTFTVDSGRELSIWGPFKVTKGSEFRVVPLVLSIEN